MRYQWLWVGLLLEALTVGRGVSELTAQAVRTPDSLLRERIARYKTDPRGPYKDIRWFCADGSFAVPREQTCPEPGGVQRARYKDEVAELAEQEHLFIGQILSTTNRSAFWDEANYQSRLKQYLLEKYLRVVDDGWVLRRARYYRGAWQIEDEEAWGYAFLVWALSDPDRTERYFFLLREAVRDIPHRADDRQTQQLRALSKYIAERYPPFGDLRVKLHGLPESGDIRRVSDFIAEHRRRMDPALLEKLQSLLHGLEEQYRPPDVQAIRSCLDRLPMSFGFRSTVEAFARAFDRPVPGSARAMASAELMWRLREVLPDAPDGEVRLALLDLSLLLEDWYRLASEEWEDPGLSAQLNRICYGTMAAAGTGLLEAWEWKAVEGGLAVPQQDSVSLRLLQGYQEKAARVVRWGAGQVRAVFREVVGLFGGFEPLAGGFVDDRIRSSVLLSLGREADDLGRRIVMATGSAPDLMGGQVRGQARGLHPGFAKGRLVVVDEQDYGGGMEKDRIYCFRRPPAQLQPVAGIVAVEAGNMVSHVQLLARNLGIPLAELSPEVFNALRRFDGQEVFFGVAPSGEVRLAPAADMTAAEQRLFRVEDRPRRRVEVPTGKLDLSVRSLLPLRSVGSEASGRTCGPKAANLGELKRLFPDQVVEGLVIPFGIFRQHMDQPMPATAGSYWDFLQRTFAEREALSASDLPASYIDSSTLARLGRLRTAIREMRLLPALTDSLRLAFGEAFGRQAWGTLPVFLRSDTNMEDLPEFTGAGLNLTVFNVVDSTAILQGIRDVWASPFSERSYRWRQHYLSNPSQVYPSVLIIPSVAVDYSGVMVTTGLSGGQAEDITVAFSRGAGGAVEGQLAESYRLHPDGMAELLSPAREPTFRLLPVSGGTETAYATFEKPMLTQGDVDELRRLAAALTRKFPDMDPPFDVECGFRDGHLWLFQVRPYVEAKSAAAWLSGSAVPGTGHDRRLPLDRN